MYSVPVFSNELILENDPQAELYDARYTLYPEMFPEVLAVQDRLTECVGAAVPLPVTVSVVVEGCALLVKVRVALALPATVGLNVTLNGTLCPAGMVSGSEIPPSVNVLLLEVAPVTVTLAP